ncbi:M3 family metallopeptidase [Actibacterium sp. 188UL27-1]|uniref:M3 family metallopeptidase n=1 Tax=Actibacterium sp. 188UL27-1 TaxID=2786961 RepID=UPI001957B4BC|nr:M3 family metallopeptidase [Actibacterium sp. 188UL27-1]MBM7068111.1 M3 family metallopeptidase [Actibacterium sp. 188UL27-1]
MTNPLLAPWTAPFELPPFADIEDTHFEPAFETALAQAEADVSAIVNNSETPTFANTIEALETYGRDLNRVLSVFYTMSGTDSNPERERMQRDFSPRLSAFSSDLVLNPTLFARIKTVWDQRNDLDLTDQGKRLLELTHRNFVRAGAELDEAGRVRLKELNGRLAELGTAFGQNLLADERDWVMPLSEEDLTGLPDFVIDAARSAGEEKGADGPVVTLSRSLIAPFLQFSPRRDLREKAYRAWTSRGANGGKTDNRAMTAEMLKLRAERADLLGYDNFAAYKLETEMAKTPEAVRDLLMAVWEPAKARAEQDGTVLETMLVADGLPAPLEAWDWRYYAEKRRLAEHDLDEAEMKPYFQLDQMIEAAFHCAKRLFNLDVKPLDAVGNHPDVRLWEVSRDGEHMAVFMGDYFARSGKRSGAWCSALRSQQRLLGDIRPHVVNVCNFAKPPAGQPALLSYDDARTLFHEFGHALHQMLSDVTYEEISGTSVPRDFVELPSQLYEHWLEVPEVLQKFATHAETGEPMPPEMLQRVLDAANFDMGFQTVEYVASALVDLEFHDGPPPADPMQKQAEILGHLGMPHAIGMRHATPHFAHVFSGGYYAAAYYSYMWSEVMDADAFAAFEEAGSAFDPETAEKLERHILSTGGSVEPDILYKQFRGRLPGVEALLKGRGLDKAA